MKIVPLKREHIDRIDAQGAQDYISTWVSPEMRDQLARSNAFAAIDGDEVLGVAGIMELWEGRAMAWAILSGNCGRHFVPIHRAVKKFLNLVDYGRIEATAAIGFGPGHRWLEMLGFKLETPVMKRYMPDGGDAAMYVRGGSL